MAIRANQTAESEAIFVPGPGALPEHMLERFRQMGEADMVRKLEAAPVTADGTPPAYLALRDEAMHRLCVGTMRTMTSIMQGLFLASLQTREYTLGEKVGLWRGKLAAGVSALWDEQLATDLAETLSAVDVPAYLLHGR